MIFGLSLSTNTESPDILASEKAPSDRGQSLRYAIRRDWSYSRYFYVAALIEPDYERYLDPIEKKQRLVLAVRDRWSSVTAQEASAFVQLLLAG